LLTAADGTETAMAMNAGAYTRYYAGVVRAIKDSTTPPVTGTEALDVMRVIEAAQASAATARTIAFD
jgi:scyllo-inositol 2-dehydrogenase (NADP+)